MTDNDIREFPHLYRCGSIEGASTNRDKAYQASDFRIFIDAAPLKVEDCHQDAGCKPAEFPHLYRCGSIEGQAMQG